MDYDHNLPLSNVYHFRPIDLSRNLLYFQYFFMGVKMRMISWIYLN